MDIKKITLEEIRLLHKAIHREMKVFTTKKLNLPPDKVYEVVLDALTAVVADVIYSLAIQVSNQDPAKFAREVFENFAKYGYYTVEENLKERVSTLQ